MFTLSHSDQQQAAKDCSMTKFNLISFGPSQTRTSTPDELNLNKKPEKGNEGKVHVYGESDRSPIPRKGCITETVPKTVKEKIQQKEVKAARFIHLNNQPLGWTKCSQLESQERTILATIKKPTEHTIATLVIYVIT